MRRELGWVQFAVEGGLGLCRLLGAVPPDVIASRLALRPFAPSMCIFVNTRLRIRCVAGAWSHAALAADLRRVIARRDVDPAVVSEARECEAIEYVDRIETRRSRASIAVDRVIFRTGGYEILCGSARTLVPEVPIRMTVTKEPSRVLRRW